MSLSLSSPPSPKDLKKKIVGKLLHENILHFTNEEIYLLGEAVLRINSYLIQCLAHVRT